MKLVDRESKDINWVIFASLIVSIPSLALLALSNISLMSQYFKVMFTLVFLFISISRPPIYLAAFMWTLMPLVNFLKGGFYFYNISTVLLILIHFVILVKSPNTMKIITSNKTYVTFFIIFLAYYLVSFFYTGRYNANLRSMDMILSAGLISIIYSQKKLFKLSFLLLGCLAITFALIIAYFGGRYLSSDLIGDTEIGGGNPIAYGLPVSLFLSMILFAPKYVMTEYLKRKGKIYYSVLLFISFVALIVTTSRGSILAFLFCFIFVLILKKSIVTTSKYILLIGMGLFFYNMASSFFPEFKVAEEFIVGRAQNKEIDLNRYSHNRALMWDMVVNEVNSGNYVFWGAGPGMQQDEFGSIALRQKVASRFNMNYAFHALPLQLVVEVGLILTLIFYIIIIKSIYSKIKMLYKNNFIIPVLGIIFWISISLSVSGLDMLSGMAFGFFLLRFKNNKLNNKVSYVKFN